MTRIACVFTGDFIRSASVPAVRLDAAMAALAEATLRFDRWWPAATQARFTRYRGDGWHFVLADPARALKACIYLAARLRAADTGLATRVSIGIGAVTRLGSADLGDAAGPAFELSGQGLDRMRRGRSHDIAGTGVTALHRATLILVGERMARWTREQAEAVALNLPSDTLTQSDAAEQMRISPQAMSARLTGAGFPALAEAAALWQAMPPSPTASAAVARDGTEPAGAMP
jgi:hypothetical protein